MTLRVLMSADAVGGVWTYAMQLAAALEGRVHFVLAVTGERPSSEQEQEASQIAGLDLHYRPYKLEWSEDPWRDVTATALWLRKLERHFRPHVIHCNGYSYAGAGFETPCVVVAHSCVTTWWRSVHRSDPPASWNRYRRHVQRGLRSADVVVAPSAGMLDALQSAYVYHTPSLVIPNGINERPLSSPIHKQPIILGAGRLWDEAKNVRTLIAAAEGLPWKVIIAGDARGLDTAPGVTMTGRLSHEQMMTGFEQAAIYAHPALYEPFGLAPLEAAWARCALVLADIPTLREIWGDAAIYADPRSPDAWRAALSSVIDDPGRRAALGAAAARRATRFGARTMADRYLQLYHDLRSTAGRRQARVSGKESFGSHEDSPVLSLADLRLESRQRPLSPRLRS